MYIIQNNFIQPFSLDIAESVLYYYFNNTTISMASVKAALSAIGLIIFNYICVLLYDYCLGIFSLPCALAHLYPY